MKFKCSGIDKDYFLYAKGWYDKTDWKKDLTTIHSKWCGCLIEEHEIGYVYDRLIHLICDIFKANNRYGINFIDFINELAPNNCWKTGANEKVYSYHEAVIKKCLSVMRFVDVENLSEDDISDILPRYIKGE